MPVKVICKKIPSSDGEHKLNTKIYLPDGDAIGLFQIIHGMCEHIGRYDAFMRKMAERGYVCFAHDHLGHGKTALDESELGYFAEYDGWKYLCRDVRVVYLYVAGKYGRKLPYYLMGHSMGSFIVRICIAAGLKPDKVIIMATGGAVPASDMGLKFVGLVKSVKGDRYVSDVIGKIAFGRYNSHFLYEKDAFSWLSSDESVREKYNCDNLCTFTFTLSAMKDLIILHNKSNSRKWFECIDKRIPMLLLSGSDDPIGGYGKGIERLFRTLKKAGANVKMKIYPACRHEILNEKCRDEVLSDIFSFIWGKM